MIPRLAVVTLVLASCVGSQSAAEAAANLVVGPNGPGYGDRNGDGVVSDENAGHAQLHVDVANAALDC